MKNILIKPALNGWIIKVGCTTIVKEKKSEMLRDIGRYISDPAKVEKEYRDNAKNKGIPPEEPALPTLHIGTGGTESVT